MDEADYDKLTWELSKVCNSYQPSKGPHEPEEIYQHFDYERIAEQDKNIERRAASLETLTRQEFSPQQLAAAIERENRYYDERQRIIDRTIDDAEHETCKAIGIAERYLETDRERDKELSVGRLPDDSDPAPTKDETLPEHLVPKLTSRKPLLAFLREPRPSRDKGTSRDDGQNISAVQPTREISNDTRRDIPGRIVRPTPDDLEL